MDHSEANWMKLEAEMKGVQDVNKAQKETIAALQKVISTQLNHIADLRTVLRARSKDAPAGT